MLRRLAQRAGLVLAGLAVAGLGLELAARAHVEGGLGPGLASLFGGRLFREVQAAESWYATDPELGYALSPTRPGINRLGIRHGALEVPKPAGARRVILLGDSISFDEAGFADRLASAWRADPGVELINAAIPGYTSYQERLLLERRLIDLEPDLVLVQYCLNDNHRFLHRITPGGQRLLTPEAKRALIPEGDGALAAFGRWSYLIVELRRRFLMPDPDPHGARPWEDREDLAPAWREGSWAALEENLAAIRDLCRERGAATAVIAFPIELQLTPEALADRDATLRPQRLLAEACGRLGIALLDLTPAFEATGDPAAHFRDGLHLSERGQSLVFEAVDAFVRERGLLAAR